MNAESCPALTSIYISPAGKQIDRSRARAARTTEKGSNQAWGWIDGCVRYVPVLFSLPSSSTSPLQRGRYTWRPASMSMAPPPLLAPPVDALLSPGPRDRSPPPSPSLGLSAILCVGVIVVCGSLSPPCGELALLRWQKKRKWLWCGRERE
jgi:hypothetical protein